MNSVAVAATVVHLPDSSAAPWPGEATYRPPGWTSPLAPGEVGPRLAAVLKSLDGDWDNATLLAEQKLLEAHVMILRQMWTTREKVWRLAELLVGPPEVDPFWHPWSHVHKMFAGVRLLDGNEGRNGFDLSLWGRVMLAGESLAFDAEGAPQSRGRTAYVNGPHGNTARYVDLCTQAARAGHKVAAVVALDGNGWFAGNTSNDDGRYDGSSPALQPADVLSCDLLCIPEGGRMSFEPPPGVKASSPTKGYALAVWGATMDDARRLPGARSSDQPDCAVRVVIDGQRWVILPGCGDVTAAR